VETLGEFYAYASKAEAKAALVAHLEPKRAQRRREADLTEGTTP
jgi:hypothetical protein